MEVSDTLDDVRPQNLRDLKLLARTLIDGEDERLSELYERLKEHLAKMTRQQDSVVSSCRDSFS